MTVEERGSQETPHSEDEHDSDGPAVHLSPEAPLTPLSQGAERSQTARSGRARCGYRKCRRFLPSDRGRDGPRRTYCQHTCRRRERVERDRDAGRIVRRTHPIGRPGRRAVQAGDRYDSLRLLRYVEPTPSGTRGEWVCDCGMTKVIAIRNVRSGAVTHCANRAAHPVGISH